MNSQDANLCQYLPPWFREIQEYQEICAAESVQMEDLAEAAEAVNTNMFIQEMDEAAVKQWEGILRILADPASETLGFRRARVLNRVSIRPPFTLGFLYQKLDELIGKGKWEVNVDYPNYTLYVKSSAQNQQYAIEVSYTINKLKPAHIVYINQPFLSQLLTLEEQVNLTQRTYHYTLGSWGLGLNPFASEQEKGAVVLPGQMSIQNALLTDTADFVNSDIASVRINGSVAISELTKSVSGSTVTIQYTVTPAQAASVTQIELLNSGGEVLTSSPVYVPISDPAIFTHTIPVQEAVS